MKSLAVELSDHGKETQKFQLGKIRNRIGKHQQVITGGKKK